MVAKIDHQTAKFNSPLNFLAIQHTERMLPPMVILQVLLLANFIKSLILIAINNVLKVNV